MTSATSSSTLAPRSTVDLSKVGRQSLVAGLLVLAFLMVWESREVRLIEARIQSVVLALVGVDTERIGTAVTFRLDEGWRGFVISIGCSIAYLIPPFLVVIAGMLGVGRITPVRALRTTVAVVATIVAVNQLRFAVIGGSMHLWGFDTGYRLSHTFLGTIVSTLGLLVGLAILVRSLTADGTRPAGPER